MNIIKFNCNDNEKNYDWTQDINNALLNAKEDTYIEFEKGVYYFYSKYAYEQHCYITNNDHSIKRIAFPVINKNKVTINGNGSKFIFVGRILPFFITKSENINLKNFSIDYKRTLHSQGEVIEAKQGNVVLKIDKEIYPYEVINGRFIWLGEDYESTYVHGMLEFDKENKRPINGAKDNHVGGELRGRELEEGIIEIHNQFRKIPEPGNVLTIKHERRFVPGIAIDHSKEINLDSVNIHAAGTMGIIAQYCENIKMNKVVVAVEEGSNRVVSANADATHFVGCTGNLIVENSCFEQQLDDAINIHGNYLDIEEVIDNTTIIAKIGHFQQVGVYGLAKDSRILLLDSDTLLDEQILTIKNKKIINNQYVRLEFNESLNLNNNKTYSIEDLDAYPSLIFRNNIVRKNRARGVLLTTRKPILVENNIIEAEGAAIKISGDTNHWHESGAISECIIRNNKITSVNYDVWGKAIIDIDPEMTKFEEGKYYHDTIIIENNEIILNNKPLVYGQSFKLLKLLNNTYIVEGENKVHFDVKEYGKIIEEGNIYK